MASAFSRSVTAWSPLARLALWRRTSGEPPPIVAHLGRHDGGVEDARASSTRSSLSSDSLRMLSQKGVRV